tara:strand:- start:234 stop:701 length:468 start_codon:yes stop_codon:yes gene_type:complete
MKKGGLSRGDTYRTVGQMQRAALVSSRKLIQACMAYNKTEVLGLLGDVDVNAKEVATNPSGTLALPGMSAFYLVTATCVQDPSFEIAKLLVGRGADVNCRNVDGTTPLIGATVHGNIQAVKFLLHIPGIDVRLADFEGDSAMHYAGDFNFVLLYD